MALTLVSLPIEVIRLICKCLCSHSDVSNFRLVCRLLADVGLTTLATTVTFALTPESIARLGSISSHPVLRHNVSTVICLTNLFTPYSTFEEWKEGRMEAQQWETIPNPNGHGYIPEIPEAELAQAWARYQTLLANQEEAFRALEPSQDIENAFRRLTNLRHLETRFLTEDGYLFHDQQIDQSLIEKRHPDIEYSDAAVYPVSPEHAYLGLPGVKLLRTLLAATASSELRSLHISELDADFFNGDGEAEVDALMWQSIRHLRTLQLTFCIEYRNEDTSRMMARRILSTNRLKNFLCSATDLENIGIVFDGLIPGFETFNAATANFLPREHTWPRLRRIRFAYTEIESAHFVDFLSSHKQTLKEVGLSHCELVPERDKGPQAPRCRWSDLFIPLVTTECPISPWSLWLSGQFKCFCPENPDPDLDPPNAYISMRDSVEGMELTVGEALGMTACSEEFDSFLHREVAGHKGLTVGTIKKGIIEDLMDNPPRRMDVRSAAIPTEYARYFKAFSTVTDSSSWGKWWWTNSNPPQRPVLEPLEVPWSS